MELEIILKTLLALSVVLSFMFIMLKFLQKYTKFGVGTRLGSKGSLKIENIVYIDDTTKIVTISSNNGFNYILSIGKQTSFLIDKYKITIAE